MSVAAAGRVEGAGRSRRGAPVAALTTGLVVLVLAASTLVRFFIAGRQPLWLDETWTGAIASQPGLAELWRQIYLDANAPLYYAFIHGWAQLFGLSDIALRLPSALFGAAAPLAVALVPVRGLPHAARLTWAAMLAAWTPGLWFSGDARCYALLVLLCTLQTLAFIRIARTPSLRGAAAWVALAALAILAHYYALFLALTQGLAYLAVQRKRAVATWPAALVFLPAAAWLAFHAPRVLAFGQTDVAWYAKLTLERLGPVRRFLLGPDEVGWGLLAVPLVAAALGAFRQARDPDAETPRDAAPWLAAGASVAATLIVVAIGFARPAFVDRYLTPFVPGLFLAIALLAAVLARRFALTYVMVVAVFAIPAAPWAFKQIQTGWRFYNWQVASADLMRGDPQRLVFLWDHPATALLEKDQLDAVGGFFFRRAGSRVEVKSIVVGRNDDPNPRLLAQAGPDRSAIIWAYDVGVQGTAARRFPPRLTTLDPTMTCRNYGRGSVGVVACDRRGSVEMRQR